MLLALPRMLPQQARWQCYVGSVRVHGQGAVRGGPASRMEIAHTLALIASLCSWASRLILDVFLHVQYAGRGEAEHMGQGGDRE